MVQLSNIVEFSKQYCEIDNFLLSCRALGRKSRECLSLLFIKFFEKDNNEKILVALLLAKKYAG